MGKRKSKQNKRKKNKSVLQSQSDQQKSISDVNQDVKREIKNKKNYNSIKTQKEMLDLGFPNPSLNHCTDETTSDAQNASLSLSENNKSNTLQNYKSVKSESNKTQIYANDVKNSFATNIYAVSHDTEVNHLSAYKSSYLTENSESDEEYSVSDCSQPVFDDWNKNKDSKNKVSLEGSFQGNEGENRYHVENILYSGASCSGFRNSKEKYRGHDTEANHLSPAYKSSYLLESDEEYSVPDFFQPVFDDWNQNKDSKNKISLEGRYQRDKGENRCHVENILYSKASCSVFRNSKEKCNFESKDLKKTISVKVDAYKSSKDIFSDVYHTWLPERRNTLQKLRTLYNEVHNDQLNFNKSQKAFKELSVVSREAKCLENQAVNFLASFTTFLSDAVSGVVSVAQAFNVDSYQSKFQEIMEHDAKITQRLYKARSNCVEMYENVEEVMRKFHSDTFSSTVNKISNTLEMGKYWEAMKTAYRKDNMPELLDIVNKFFNDTFQSSKLEIVSDTIQSYVDDNPAALEACKSAGMATYEYINTCTVYRGISQNNSVLRGINIASNNYQIIKNKDEINRLEYVIEENLHQSKLESQIEDAIESFESELKEINYIYFELFKIHVDYDDF